MAIAGSLLSFLRSCADSRPAIPVWRSFLFHRAPPSKGRDDTNSKAHDDARVRPLHGRPATRVEPGNASGAEHPERNLNGRRESAGVRVNDLWFVPPAPVSWRRQSIGAEPLSTVHVHIERALLDSVAQRMGLDASRELSLGDAMHFHDPLIAAMRAAPDSPGDRLPPAQSRRRSGDCRTGHAGRAKQLSFCAGVPPRDRRDTASVRYARAARGSGETAAHDGSNGTANCARGWVRECQSFLHAVHAWLWRDAACLPVAHPGASVSRLAAPPRLVTAVAAGGRYARLTPDVNTNTVAGPSRAIMLAIGRTIR